MTVVSCENVMHIYHLEGNEVIALRGVDLQVEEGESVALLGPSGAGKSTLLWLLAGLLRPSAGGLRVLGRDVEKLGPGALTRLRAREIGIVLQNPARNVFAHATAAQNVANAQRIARSRRASRSRPVNELLGRVGLADLAGRPAGRLSGGEQQRLAVAIALAHRPKLLLADEPTSQLDRESADAVIDLLREAGAENGATVVVVTHDPAVGAAFDRGLTIRDGRVGTEARDGNEYLVVGRDGSVQLPPALQELLPPGTRARARALPDGVELRRVHEGEDG
ncbi:ATP-binding cassette domain-containing protein [Actinomadura barringtoniae]|uniref:ATP-binding cassette domain-containing protein n=1 Tax=Actinomadura barringtoniae TaxID=1427535 RepID=A0A939PJK0_9ACTN|nr:ATP-binding cassette domain-containing protein [Actinomadura barringtoniae]MBO2449746.1 ATP-binding cassette domain-containing protein [Actinomadura barringtoniae]